MFRILIQFNGVWHPMNGVHPTKDDALWAIGLWKQANRCLGDRCFRVEAVDDKQGIRDRLSAELAKATGVA